MKSLFLATIISFFLALNLQAQTQGIAYPAVGKGVATTFVTDYHSLGINSSSLGWGTGYEKKKFTMGMSEFNLGFYSDSLNADKLKKLYSAIRQDISGNIKDSARWDEQKQFAKEYANAGMQVDFSYNWLGFSYQGKKFGGIAVSINENYNWYSRLSEQTTDVIFNGKLADYFDSLTIVISGDTSTIANDPNLSDDTLSAVIMGTISTPLSISQLTQGSEVRFAWNRNYNVGYGRKIIGNDSTFALYAGVGARYIQSMAMFNMESNGNEFYIYSSFNPNYKIDYGQVVENFTKTGSIPRPVGSGYGFDLSASAVLMNKIKVAAAVNNIGSVTYTRNVYRVADSIVGSMSVDGLANYNVTNSIYNFLEDGGVLTLVGEEKYTIKNAATYRLGASIELGKFARIGMDVVGPFNADNPGSLQNPIISFGGDIRPARWIRLSAGYLGGGIYKHNIPVGVNFILGGGTYEFGISSRDALSFFLDGSNSISSAFGFARVRF